jgi:hypothetical protein
MRLQSKLLYHVLTAYRYAALCSSMQLYAALRIDQYKLCMKQLVCISLTSCVSTASSIELVLSVLQSAGAEPSVPPVMSHSSTLVTHDSTGDEMLIACSSMHTTAHLTTLQPSRITRHLVVTRTITTNSQYQDSWLTATSALHRFKSTLTILNCLIQASAVPQSAGYQRTCSVLQVLL